jgi:hypothetical protein
MAIPLVATLIYDGYFSFHYVLLHTAAYHAIRAYYNLHRAHSY